MSVVKQITLVCELCPPRDPRRDWRPSTLTLPGSSATGARLHARKFKGWRTDKLGRDICPDHPKLKGARQ
jgi:hypothetical protein